MEDRELKAASVWVRGARHEYRRFLFDTEVVLTGVDMTVRRGEVYALLGRSGSGKTTLLRALVGQHVLDDGVVRVFGRAPGDPEGGVPGSAVGYMPQEVAVHDGFTIGETLSFHGRLLGMATADVRDAASRLVDALQLPGEGKLVGALSFGEKRRVSLAIALLHSPPLLILDEPTVGADPVLRHSIWQLLLAVAAGGTTVVISTHYIEEAKSAHTVGLLRSGRLVLEDSPAAILRRYGGPRGRRDADSETVPELERAVRRLCTLLDHPDDDFEVDPEIEAEETVDLGVGTPPGTPPELPISTLLPHRPLTLNPLRTRHKLGALLWKDCVYLCRHGLLLGVQATFFVFITVLACAVLGHWPNEVRVDVVNEEANCSGTSGAGAVPVGAPLSCVVIARLPQRGMRPVFQEDVSAARASVHSGASWGVLHFGPDFSKALVLRVVNGSDNNEILDASDVGAHLDTTDYVVSNMITKRLTEIMFEVVHSLSPSMTNFMKFEEPVFGRAEPVNTHTLMPGVLLGYMTTFAASLVMSTLLMEKTDKFMERTLVAGVTMSELMTCWLAVLLPVVLAVNLVSHALIFGPMAIPCEGSTALMYSLCSALCLMTMLAGLLFASVFDNYLAAILACHQFAVSFLFLSGVLWPLQAMHWSLRWLAVVMPWSYSMEAARAVLQRGWGLQHLQVWLGFCSCAVWTLIFLAALVVVHRPRKGQPKL